MTRPLLGQQFTQALRRVNGNHFSIIHALDRRWAVLLVFGLEISAWNKGNGHFNGLSDRQTLPKTSLEHFILLPISNVLQHNVAWGMRVTVLAQQVMQFRVEFQLIGTRSLSLLERVRVAPGKNARVPQKAQNALLNHQPGFRTVLFGSAMKQSRLLLMLQDDTIHPTLAAQFVDTSAKGTLFLRFHFYFISLIPLHGRKEKCLKRD
jgi:hypothetical protein